MSSSAEEDRMALVACPECGQQVSTDAASCPHCGKPLTASAGSAVVTPGGGIGLVPPGLPTTAEQTLWEGGPSVALVYGGVLGLIIKTAVLVVLGYFAITAGLPALASVSPDIGSLVDANATTLTWVIVLIIGVVLIRSALSLAAAVARIKTTHYKVTNQRVILERGMVSKSLEEIDMRSIDDTEFHQTFLDRIFGIGEVWIVSTDKVAPRVVLHGVHEPRKTRELVRSMAYQASQRQLFTRST